MEMGRQISVPAGWAKEKGASWNQGESASCVEGAHRVGSSGGGASCPPVPPTCLHSVLREAEMGGGRRRESGRENAEGGEKRGRGETLARK